MTKLVLLDTTKTGKPAHDFENKLCRLVVGQEDAIQEIVKAYQAELTGLSPDGRPVANFLFLGPTGSGKTRIVEATAQALFNDPRAVIKIDCAEFQHSHEIAKLIGSPPGYLGHRETHALLSQEALNKNFTDKVKLSIVLFDEIEKASDALWNLLLGILDKGILTLGDNRRVDFSATMVFMTSNVGAAEMEAMRTPRLGFRSVPANADHDHKLQGRLSQAGFKPLGHDDLRYIVNLELEMVQERVRCAADDDSSTLNVTDGARELLLAEGTDSRYGARHLKRAIERDLVQPLANLLATAQLRRGDTICVTRSGNARSLTFFREITTAEVRAKVLPVAA